MDETIIFWIFRTDSIRYGHRRVFLLGNKSFWKELTCKFGQGITFNSIQFNNTEDRTMNVNQLIISTSRWWDEDLLTRSYPEVMQNDIRWKLFSMYGGNDTEMKLYLSTRVLRLEGRILENHKTLMSFLAQSEQKGWSCSKETHCPGQINKLFFNENDGNDHNNIVLFVYSKKIFVSFRKKKYLYIVQI